MTPIPNNTHLRIIKQHYPDLQPTQITSLTGGNDHFVFVINQETVFRFPRSPDETKPNTPDFVKQLAKISPVLVPVGEYHFDEPSGISYEISTFIKGVSFYPHVAGTFTHKELMAVAQQLGQFLTALHSFPLEQAREMRVNEMDPSLFWLYMHEVAYPYLRTSACPHISRQTHDWVRELFTEYITTDPSNPIPNQCHAFRYVGLPHHRRS